MDDGICVGGREDLADEGKRSRTESGVVVAVLGEFLENVENVTGDDGVSSILLPDLKNSWGQDMFVFGSNLLIDLHKTVKAFNKIHKLRSRNF